jgi:ATP-binding cassette subfamily C (CFTR/MRP) protein 1
VDKSNCSHRWVKAVQRRVGIASTVIRQMKSVKLSGLVEGMAQLVQSERIRELYMAKQFRGLSVWVNTLSSAPTTFSALVTFATYSIKAQIQHTPGLTTAQAFTSFAILALLTAPASQLLGAIPMITSGMGCVRRIHAFLMSEPFDDFRDVRGGAHIYHPVEKEEKFEPLEKDVERSSQGSEAPVISVSNLILKPTEHPEKCYITFDAGRGSLTTILGPVGCGKSTLLKTLLGELKPESGNISVSTAFVGYCSQSPWLPNERVRDAILGANDFEEDWYHEVIEVCQLQTDFTQMPKEDLTIMGSRGIVLSGGQKHRVVRLNERYTLSCSRINTKF